ncbi:MAG: hypothetical protein ACKO72_06470 [Actinomycetes bacterium]
MRRIRFVAIASVSLVVLAACGGSSAKDGQERPGRSTTTSAAASGGGGFGDLAARAEDADVAVTYRNGGQDGEFTIAQFEGDSYLSFGNDAFYRQDGRSITCSGRGADAACFELPGEVDLAGTIVASFFGTYAALFDGLRSASPAFGPVRTSTSSDTIAGRPAACATISAEVLGRSGDVTVCLDAETGFLLRAVAGDTRDSSGIEATSFRASTASDVTPPAAPQGIPGA